MLLYKTRRLNETNLLWHNHLYFLVSFYILCKPFLFIYLALQFVFAVWKNKMILVIVSRWSRIFLNNLLVFTENLGFFPRTQI